jgi:hypothetical protein
VIFRQATFLSQRVIWVDDSKITWWFRWIGDLESQNSPKKRIITMGVCSVPKIPNQPKPAVNHVRACPWEMMGTCQVMMWACWRVSWAKSICSSVYACLPIRIIYVYIYMCVCVYTYLIIFICVHMQLFSFLFMFSSFFIFVPGRKTMRWSRLEMLWEQRC